MLQKLRSWAHAIKVDIVAVWLASRDPRVPWYAKAVAGAAAAYALSPIDLIPDFIPVIGYLDDLVIVPLLVFLAIWLIPPDLMTEFRAEAVHREELPHNYFGAAFIVLIWIATAILLLMIFWPSGAH